jgi:hypothetical protein
MAPIYGSMLASPVLVLAAAVVVVALGKRPGNSDVVVVVLGAMTEPMTMPPMYPATSPIPPRTRRDMFEQVAAAPSERRRP